MTFPFGSAEIIKGSALDLPLPAATVDLIVTSPPYFGLRSYQDDGEALVEQVGGEATPLEYLDALIAATREMTRVLKPGGSIWVNLGDKYSQRTQTRRSSHQPGMFEGKFPEFAETWAERAKKGHVRMPNDNVVSPGLSVREKSLMGIPWRYALRCIDDLGLILRAELIWSKPNGLPESVTDRVRRSHETWFHFTKQPRYFSAVDEIREPYSERVQERQSYAGRDIPKGKWPEESGRMDGNGQRGILGFAHAGMSPLGKLPGSVWTIATQPLRVPAELGIDHFAAFPMEWPRRIIQGWSPAGVCTVCGEGLRPVSTTQRTIDGVPVDDLGGWKRGREGDTAGIGNFRFGTSRRVTGYACACGDAEPSRNPVRVRPLVAETLPATTPAMVLDPFGGTGTTALMAKVLGRRGISVDLSSDYCRLAEWRVNDPKQLAIAEKEDHQIVSVRTRVLFKGQVHHPRDGRLPRMPRTFPTPAPAPSGEIARSVWDALTGPDAERARDDIVRHYQSLVSAMAYKFKSTLPSYIVDEDLLSYGQMGLLRAIERYDPEAGPFRRFASSYVYGAILDELRSQDWAPRGLRREQRMVREATSRLGHTEETPSLASVAEHLGWDAARLASTMRQVTNSHHRTLDATDGVPHQSDVDGSYQSDLLCQVFAETFETLDEVSQFVVARVYFLHETLITVSSTTGLPLAVVRRVHMEAVNYLFDRVRHAVSVS